MSTRQIKMEVSNTKQLIGQRTVLPNYEKLLYGVLLILVCGGAIFTILNFDDNDKFYIIIAVLTGILGIYYLGFAIKLFIRKKDVIYATENSLILRLRNEKVIPFDDIEDITMKLYKYRVKKGVYGKYSSGMIFIKLKDGTTYRINDIKDASGVCSSLRKTILSR